jgi:hypothetical protein
VASCEAILVLLSASSVVGLAKRGTSSRGFFATRRSLSIGGATGSATASSKGKLRLATLRRNVPVMIRPVVVAVVAVELLLLASVEMDTSCVDIDASTVSLSIVDLVATSGMMW